MSRFNDDTSTVTGCADLLTGANCTETWKESLDPAATTIQVLVLCSLVPSFFIVSRLLINAIKVAWHAHREQLKQDHSLRLFTLHSLWWAIFCVAILYGFGMAMEYRFDDFRGIACVISLLVSNALIMQAGTYLLVLYISVVNNQISEQGFLETIDLKVLKFFAVPWPLYLIAVIFLGLILAQVVTSPLFVISFGYGAMVVYPLLPLIYFQRIYMNKLATLLDSMLNNPGLVLNEKLRARWEGVARKSRIFGLFSFPTGIVFAGLFIAALTTNAFDYPLFLLIFMSLNGLNFSVFLILIINIFKQSENESERTGSSAESKSLEVPTSNQHLEHSI